MMASAAPGAIYIGNYLIHAKTPGYRTKLFPSGKPGLVIGLILVGMYLMMASAAPGAIYIGNYLIHAKTPGYRTKLFPSGKPGLVIGLILGSLFLFAAGVLVFLISIVRML